MQIKQTGPLLLRSAYRRRFWEPLLFCECHFVWDVWIVLPSRHRQIQLVKTAFRRASVASDCYSGVSSGCVPKHSRDRLIVSARRCLTAFFAAEPCCVGFAGHKALFCQYRRTVHVFQQGKAALVPYFGMGALHQLSLTVALIIDVPDARRGRAMLCACGLHSLPPAAARSNSSPDARCGPVRTDSTQSRTRRSHSRCGVRRGDGAAAAAALWASDGPSRTLFAGRCGGIIAVRGYCSGDDNLGPACSSREQSLRRSGSRHLFFFDDSPCARVCFHRGRHRCTTRYGGSPTTVAGTLRRHSLSAG